MAAIRLQIIVFGFDGHFAITISPLQRINKNDLPIINHDYDQAIH